MVQTSDPEWISKQSIICPTNKATDMINSKIVDLFLVMQMSVIHDSVEDEPPTEYLNNCNFK